MTPASKRPFLIWVTQILVALVCAIFIAISILITFKVIPQLLANGFSAWRIALGSAIQATCITSLVLLFMGLVKRRRWAWYGSIVFALLLLVLFIHSNLYPPDGPIPLLPIASNQMLGAVIGEAMITLLVVIYPIRLFFSHKVRAFFSVVR